MNRPTSVTVIGAGGNIGSHLVPHLARMHHVEQVTLIDPDVYRPHNLFGQDIAASDISKPKVRVQERRLKRIRPDLRVRAIASRVEKVPLGRLRADVLLSCLDTRSARQWVNEAVRHLGVPWIDAGVDGDGLIARVTVFPVGTDTACLECAWGQPDYDALEQVYPCTGHSDGPPTNAPSAVGALAASMQAIACQQVLDGGGAQAAEQVFLDMRSQAHFVTRLQRNPACRLFDHSPWTIVGTRARTLRDVFAGADAAGYGAAQSLRAGRAFTRRMRCPSCGWSLAGLRLQSPAPQPRCKRCREPLVATVLDLESELLRSRVNNRDLNRSLRRVGFRDQDVISAVCARGVAHFEIGASGAGCTARGPASAGDAPVAPHV